MVLEVAVCSLEQIGALHERKVERHVILEMMRTSCGCIGHCYIFVVSGREKNLACLYLHLLRGECVAVVAADKVHVYDSDGEEVVLGDYPFC